jgi:hypothetical protein
MPTAEADMNPITISTSVDSVCFIRSGKAFTIVA